MNTDKKNRKTLKNLAMVVAVVVIVMIVALVAIKQYDRNVELSDEEITQYVETMRLMELTEDVSSALNKKCYYQFMAVDDNNNGRFDPETDHYYYWGNPEKQVYYPYLMDDGRIVFTDEDGVIWQMANLGSKTETVEEIGWINYQGSGNRLYMTTSLDWVVENSSPDQVDFFKFNHLVKSIDLTDGMKYLGTAKNKFVVQDDTTIYQINTETWEFENLADGQVLELNYRFDKTNSGILYTDEKDRVKVLLYDGKVENVKYPGGYQDGLAEIAEDSDNTY